MPINDIKKKGGKGEQPSKADKTGPEVLEINSKVQVVTKEVPGLQGIKQKRVEKVKAVDSLTQEGALELPSAKRGGKSPGGKAAKRSTSNAEETQSAPEASRDAKRLKKSREKTLLGKADSMEETAKTNLKSSGRSQPSGAKPSSNKAAHVEEVPMKEAEIADAEIAIVQPNCDGAILEKATKALEAARRAIGQSANVRATPNCQRCQRYSENFTALLVRELECSTFRMVDRKLSNFAHPIQGL